MMPHTGVGCAVHKNKRLLFWRNLALEVGSHGDLRHQQYNRPRLNVQHLSRRGVVSGTIGTIAGQNRGHRVFTQAGNNHLIQHGIQFPLQCGPLLISGVRPTFQERFHINLVGHHKLQTAYQVLTDVQQGFHHQRDPLGRGVGTAYHQFQHTLTNRSDQLIITISVLLLIQGDKAGHHGTVIPGLCDPFTDLLLQMLHQLGTGILCQL